MPRTHNIVSVVEFIHAHLDDRAMPQLPGITAQKIIERPLILARACKARVVTGGTQPLYNYDDDVIIMPVQSFYTFARIFTRPTTYAINILHELVHWAGHPRRIGRQRFREPYDPIYLREELVAELGSALLCHDLAITSRPTLPHARYLNRYLAELSNPAIDLAVALSHANRAAAYLTGIARHELR